jgi:hypothetical protein
MTYNTEAYMKQKRRPKWRNWLGAFALMYVWIIGLLFSMSNNNAFLDFAMSALCSGCMLVLVFEIADLDSTAKNINKEAGYLKEELDWLKFEYAELKKEQQRSIPIGAGQN